MKVVVCAPLVSLALAFGMPAHALALSEVRIEPADITPIDRAPGDAITATVLYGAPPIALMRYALAPASESWNVIGGARITNYSDTAIGGETTAPSSKFVVVGDRYAPNFAFTLTPWSAVKVGFDYTLTTSISGESFAGPDLPYAYASVELAIAAFAPLGASGDPHDYRQLDYVSVIAELNSAADPVGATYQTRSGRLDASFENLTADPAYFAFRAEMVSYGSSAAVPEPQRVTLLLVGLAFVGLAAGRRRLRTRAACAPGASGRTGCPR